MSNKYLEKIASVKDTFRSVARDWKRSSLTSKIGLPMSGAGLAMGVANYKNSIQNRKDSRQRAELEAKSLETLQTIAKKINKPQKVVLRVDRE